MVLHSTRWLALSYFTYFFSYGIFLPFWSVWLSGLGLTPETIGMLLGAGLPPADCAAGQRPVPTDLFSTHSGFADAAFCTRILGRPPCRLADGDYRRL